MTMIHWSIQRNILSLVIVVAAAMASTDTSSFFPDIHGNLTKITWAHAVNNQSYLNETLNNDSIMMIEADIILGKLDDTGDEIPVMGHPPASQSDLSLSDFLAKISDFNSYNTNIHKKGAKLDFKSIDVFLKSIPTVLNYSQNNFPIWINADILPGPINASTATPVDADQFLNGTKQFPNSVLSLGWTTDNGNSNGSYDSNQIQNMTDAISKNNVTQNITFAVRAGFAAESIELLTGLVNSTINSTLTIWCSSPDDVYDVNNLRQLIAKVGISRVYIDVPSELLAQLHLDDLPNSSSKFTSSMFSSLILVLVTIFLIL